MILYKAQWKIKKLDNLDTFGTIYVIAKDAIEAMNKVIVFERRCGFDAVITSLDIVKESQSLICLEQVIY